MKNFLQLLKREFKQFFANRTLLSVFFVAPIIYAVMLASVYKQGKVVDLPIVVVDRDNSPMSSQMIEMLDENEGIAVMKILPESNDVQKTLIDLDAAAVIVIPDRFEADMLQARYPDVMIYANTANMLTANFATKSIQTSLGTFAAGAEIKALQRKGMPGIQSASRYEPFKQNFVKVYNETGNYFTFMWPAMLAVILQQVILLAMAVSIAFEVENKTFGMGIVSKTKSAWTTLIVKAFPMWVLSIPIVIVYYGFHQLYNAPIPDNAWNYMIITALFIVSTTLLGTVISALIPNALKATQILMLMSSPGFIIGGYTWPMQAMAGPIQVLADMLPLTPFLKAFRMMLMEGAELYQVMPSITHLSIQIVIYAILSWILVKWRIKKESKNLQTTEA